MKSRNILILLVVLLLGSEAYGEESMGDLQIQFTGMRTLNGQILLNIFNEKKDFPDSNKKAYRYAILVLATNKTQITIKDLPYGTYAIAVLHDENSSLNVEKNGLGIPREGVAFSQNAFHAMRAPSFDECAFSLDQPVLKMKLKFHYFLKLKD